MASGILLTYMVANQFLENKDIKIQENKQVVARGHRGGGISKIGEGDRAV